MLTQSNLLTDVYDALGETSGNSSWTDAQVVRAINREAGNLSQSLTFRVGAFVVEGDGVRASHALPEAVTRVVIVTENNAVSPQITYADAVSAVFGRTLLAPDLYVSFGWAFEPPDRVRFQPVLASGEDRTVYAVCGPGAIRETAYSTGTVSATNDSATVTGSGTTWTSNASGGDTIVIDGEGYVVESVASDTSLTLTERYRGSTASGLSYTIGGHLIAPATAAGLIAYAAAQRLALDFGDDETAARNLGRYRRELRRYRGTLERLQSGRVRA